MRFREGREGVKRVPLYTWDSVILLMLDIKWHPRTVGCDTIVMILEKEGRVWVVSLSVQEACSCEGFLRFRHWASRALGLGFGRRTETAVKDGGSDYIQM